MRPRSCNRWNLKNGILACEFSAPVAGEVVIQLSKAPQGPLIASGHPADFEWDEKNSVVRLPVPAGKGSANRVRIGIAIEPPEASAFFGDITRLVIGKPNIIPTSLTHPICLRIVPGCSRHRGFT